MKFIFSQDYQHQKEKIFSFIENFQEEGRMLGKGTRNKIKVFSLDGKNINIKSFKIPNAINKVAYRFFRKSKAQRSFEYAQYLLSKNIGTPQPIAYIEETSAFAFKKSYYISEQMDYDLTFREVEQKVNFPQRKEILRAFTQFTFELHEKNIEFLDHSPGNTLIQLNQEDYKFFLVDLNRMNFKAMDFDARMKNFSRLTPKKEFVKIMAYEYAQLINKPEHEVFEKMWFFAQDFQKKFHQKKELKKKLKFWK